jgi:hypothetical protein
MARGILALVGDTAVAERHRRWQHETSAGDGDRDS